MTEPTWTVEAHCFHEPEAVVAMRILQDRIPEDCEITKIERLDGNLWIAHYEKRMGRRP